MLLKEKRVYKMLCVVCVMIGLLGMASISLAQGDVWTKKADMPTGRFWLSCEVVDGKIYAIGGAMAVGAPTLSTVEEYDPVSDTWTSKQDMPEALRSMASAVVDGKIYTIGGQPDLEMVVTSGLRTLQVYDPINDSWTQKTDMPTRREAASASVVNGIIYVMGGVAPGGVMLDVVEAYDPATDTWTSKAPMPTARHALSTAVVDGKIYAMGSGRGGRMVEEYDPATDIWTTKGDMPVSSGYFGTGVVDGIIYAMGGASNPASPYSQVFAYDPSVDEWSEKTSMQTGKFALGAGVVNGKIYTIGGAVDWPPTPLSAVEEYDPALDPLNPTSIEALFWGALKGMFR
jgi:N-acetylneuraminic acid mutarotase